MWVFRASCLLVWSSTTAIYIVKGGKNSNKAGTVTCVENVLLVYIRRSIVVTDYCVPCVVSVIALPTPSGLYSSNGHCCQEVSDPQSSDLPTHLTPEWPCDLDTKTDIWLWSQNNVGFFSQFFFLLWHSSAYNSCKYLLSCIMPRNPFNWLRYISTVAKDMSEKGFLVYSLTCFLLLLFIYLFVYLSFALWSAQNFIFYDHSVHTP